MNLSTLFANTSRDAHACAAMRVLAIPGLRSAGIDRAVKHLP